MKLVFMVPKEKISHISNSNKNLMALIQRLPQYQPQNKLSTKEYQEYLIMNILPQTSRFKNQDSIVVNYFDYVKIVLNIQFQGR